MKKRRSFSREFEREVAGMAPLSHESVEVAREDLGRYLLGYYNWKRPHQAHGGLAPARAEQQLKMVSGFFDR